MKHFDNEPLYLVSQEDAYRIEGLISTLAMAIWEILRQGERVSPPPDGPDATFAQNMFLNETRSILDPTNHDDF